MIKKFLIFIIISFIMFLPSVFAIKNNSNYSNKHRFKESLYQHVWCSAHNGIEEYKNKDFTRVDCLTETHAVEFDFANKWAESIGQALYYQLMTGKRGMVVLILENPKHEIIYFIRVQKLAQLYDFDVEYITPEILMP